MVGETEIQMQAARAQLRPGRLSNDEVRAMAALEWWDEQRVRLLPIDKRTREAWKTYPVRVFCMSSSACACESQYTLLVQSREGGFVTRNCPQCGGKTTLAEHEFVKQVIMFVACLSCRRMMAKAKIGKNYGFVCAIEDCGKDHSIVGEDGKVHVVRRQPGFRLADLLPNWEDLV